MSFLTGKECPGKINVLIVDHHVQKNFSLCTDVPPPSVKIGRGDVCESPSLIVSRYTFA